MLIQSDAFNLPYKSKTFHACVTSPPYYGLRKYSGEQGERPLGLEDTAEEHIERMVVIFREVYRVLRDDGVLWMNYGDAFEDGNLMMLPHRLAIALQADGWIVRNDLVWFKRNPMPESVAGWRWERTRTKKERSQHAKEHNIKGGTEAMLRDASIHQGIGPHWVPDWEYGDDYVLRKSSWRHTRQHEYVFMLVKKMGYQCNQEVVREAASYPNDDRGARADARRGTDMNSMSGKTGTGRNPRSVLKATEPRCYELPDGTICIVSEDCPIHGHQQSSRKLRKGEHDEQQGSFVSHTDSTDNYLAEGQPSEQLSNSDHNSQQPRRSKKDCQNPGNEQTHILGSIDENKTEVSHSVACDEDAQILLDNENTQALATYPSEDENSCSDGHAAKDHNNADRKRNASLSEPDTPFDSEVLSHTGHNEFVCSCEWIIPQAQCAPSVLDVPTAPYSGAHYATFPPNLIAPLIRASVPRRCCPECGMAWAPVVERGSLEAYNERGKFGYSADKMDENQYDQGSNRARDGHMPGRHFPNTVTDYRPTCECGVMEHEPGIILDIFGGSGTTGMVAKQLMRRWVVMDISRPYLDEQAKVRTGTGTPANALDGLPMFGGDDE